MAGIAPGVEIGVNQRGIRVEISPGQSRADGTGGQYADKQYPAGGTNWKTLRLFQPQPFF